MYRGLKKSLKKAIEYIQAQPIVLPIVARGVRVIPGDFASEGDVARHAAGRVSSTLLELGSAALAERG